MKTTGIVRRIDDLGRIVIPKEIRRGLNIKEGDPFEIFTDNKMICFQKYSMAPTLLDIAVPVIKSAQANLPFPIIMFDNDECIYCSKGKPKNDLISDSMRDLINSRAPYLRVVKGINNVYPFLYNHLTLLAGLPIIIDGDIIGYIGYYSDGLQQSTIGIDIGRLQTVLDIIKDMLSGR